MRRGGVLNRAQQLQLTPLVKKTKVKASLQGVSALKALGKDELNVVFFKSTWSLVREEITQAVLNFFDTGRALNDNVILSHKIVKGYRRQRISKSCMVLEELKMPTRLIKWIMQCVTIVTYPIQINGRSTIRIKTDPNFHYYPRCKAQTIFSQNSGLVSNIEKSSVYFYGVRQEIQMETLKELQFFME
ncbi:hypothetical protein H5410_037570, partial [Solanum commersonii]